MRARLLLVLMLISTFIVFLIELLYAFSTPRASDLNIYLVAAGRLNNGLPLYDLEGLRANQFSEWYKYPPLMAGLLRPLALLDVDTARNAWRVFLTLCLLGAAYMTIHTFNNHPLSLDSGQSPAPQPPVLPLAFLFAPTTIALLVLTFVFRPAIDAINLGQPDPLILLLMVTTLAALRSGHPLLSGIPLALAVALKLYPGLLALYLLVKREWQALAGFAAALAGWGLLGIFLASPADSITYATQVLPSTSGTTAWPANQTIAGFFARLFTDRFYRLEPFPDDLELRSLLLKIITYASAALVLGLTLWLSRKPAARSTAAYSLGFCLVMTASIFVLPVAWIHYFTSLLLAFAVAFYSFRQGWPYWKLSNPSLAFWAVILLIIAAFLLAYENIWLLFDRTNLGGLWKLSLSYKLYGELALWGGLLILQHLSIKSTPTTKIDTSREPNQP